MECVGGGNRNVLLERTIIVMKTNVRLMLSVFYRFN